MPSLEQIEQFKEVLNQLGDEPAILAERGESLEDVPAPETGLPEDLTELLGDLGDLGPGTAEEPGGEGVEAPEEPELDQFPDEFFGEGAGVEDENLLSGFGDTDILEELPDVIPDEEQEEIPEEPAVPPAEESESSSEEKETAFEIEEPSEEGEQEFVLPEEIPDQISDEIQDEFPEEVPEEISEEIGAAEIEALDFEDEFALPEELTSGDADEMQVAEPGEGISEEEPGTELGEEIESFEDFEPGEPEPVEPGPGEPEELELPDMEALEIDTEELQEPGEGAEEGGEEDFELPGEEDFELPDDLKFSEDEELDTLGEEDLEGEGFSLGEISEDFGKLEETRGKEEEKAPAITDFIPEEEAVLELSDEEFRSLQRTMSTLPRNLKLEIEELIGEKGLAGKDLTRLVNLLVQGESLRKIADAAGKILGRKILIPEQYEKKTGVEFEAERGTFAYAFRNNILPFLKITGAALLVLGFIAFVGYRFVYRPIHARNLYTRGYEEIYNQQFIQANDYFDRAFKEWRKQEWFYRYAEAFIENREYTRAEEKYEQLLTVYPLDRKGIFDYAALETDTLGNYEKAEELYNLILYDEIYDYDALLKLGDNYMAWAEEEPSKFEEARFTYATLIQQYGHLDDLELRMLQYFMRTDQLDEVIRLKDQFEMNPKAEIDPLIYAELGGYLITNNHLDDVQQILFRVLEEDDTLPEAHYHLSRYFRRIEEYSEEEKAIRNTLLHIDKDSSLTRSRLEILINTINRQGEIYLDRDEVLSAQESFQEALDFYENALEDKILAKKSEFGKIYSNLGDIYYYQMNDYQTSSGLYTQAQNNNYSPPGLVYKKGYISYQRSNYQQALLDFYAASEGFSLNKNLNFATANTLVKRNDYFSAQGYYYDLLASLEQERREIPFLLPEEKPEHQRLIEYLIKCYNNLGVTMYYLGDRTGERDTKYSEALVYLTKSAELKDAYSRDPESMERPETRNLAWLNSRGILYPVSGFLPQIYSEIPKDMDERIF